MKAQLAIGLLLLAGISHHTCAQVPNDRDLRDVANNQPYSALNRATAANKAAAEAGEAHPIHYCTPD